MHFNQKLLKSKPRNTGYAILTKYKINKSWTEYLSSITIVRNIRISDSGRLYHIWRLDLRAWSPNRELLSHKYTPIKKRKCWFPYSRGTIITKTPSGLSRAAETWSEITNYVVMHLVDILAYRVYYKGCEWLHSIDGNIRVSIAKGKIFCVFRDALRAVQFSWAVFN